VGATSVCLYVFKLQINSVVKCFYQKQLRWPIHITDWKPQILLCCYKNNSIILAVTDTINLRVTIILREVVN